MADKRTTPETPAGAQPDAPQDAGSGPRRKKRAAPTIDLTATEMPSPPHEAAPPPQSDPPPAPAQEPPAEARPGDPISLATLAAGVTGAATVMLVLVALWLTGLLPVRFMASTDTGAQVSVDTKAIDALTQRVSKIEGTISKLPAGDAGVAERLAAADSAMKSLGIALTALNRRSDDTAATASQARERADAAVKAVTELRASVQDAAKNSSSGISLADLDALQKRMAALEQSAKAARDDIAKASSADIAARLALSAAGLRDAVASGAPFAAELAQAKSLGADDKVLAPLAPFAATGVPTPPALAQELRALLPAMLKISGAQALEGGFLERLQANAGKLVRVRPVDAPPGDDPSAVLARLEIDAAKADIAAALADLGKLADATRAPAQAWIERAKARQAALAAARQYAADTARALGPR
ncbi:MAG: COG4223 family protein [Hyphomicrobiales bacterium]